MKWVQKSQKAFKIHKGQRDDSTAERWKRNRRKIRKIKHKKSSDKIIFNIR